MKTCILNVFMALESPQSPLFRKYACAIAHEYGIILEDEDDYQDLFDAIPDLAKSFRTVCDVAKMGRWFSWNACAEQQLKEFWVAKMLYEHHLGDEVEDPDDAAVGFEDLEKVARAKTPRAELSALASAQGGIKLAYKLMTSALFTHAKIMAVVLRPLWSWYSGHVKRVTCPKEGLKETLASAQGRWASDRQFEELVSVSFLRNGVREMDLPAGRSAALEKAYTLTWELLSRRCWSMACRHHGPPETYSPLLRGGAPAERVLQCMRVEWGKCIKLEQRAHEYLPASRLLQDMHFIRPQPVRLMFALFEGAGWSLTPLLASAQEHMLKAGQHLLRGLLQVWPDNKIVEDLHNTIRADSKKGRTSKRKALRQQSVAVASPIFVNRRIPHTAEVTIEQWLRESSKPLLQRRVLNHLSSKHKMSREWAKLLGTKAWPTCNETASRRGVAAWEWLQHGHEDAQTIALAQGRAPPSLDTGLFSRLVIGLQLVQCPDGTVAASLGHGAWALLLFPLDVLASAQDSGLRTLTFRCNRPRCWFAHVVEPRDWYTLNTSAEAAWNRVVIREDSPPTPLLQTALSKSKDSEASLAS